jgi:hypothetical protein
MGRIPCTGAFVEQRIESLSRCGSSRLRIDPDGLAQQVG